jgi:hypothetical protein
MFGILVGHLPDVGCVKTKDLRARIAKQDRGMSGNDELGLTFRFQVLQEPYKLDLARR